MKVKVLITLLLALTLVVSPSYAKKKDQDRQLPPGLAKNVKRGKPLPPGWQKKIAPGNILEREIYMQGKIIAPLDPLGIVTIRIDDKVLRVHQKSMEILEILAD
ncbi:MAG: hypothetical protein RQ753_09005 [Desulfurivibrionaceae bacterium]|nr:hypothetical protein [Desulfobulbales bacterium]MDT8335826.1 hypothetical protein [Desulfurivibrionaceae bacterium]